MVLSTLGILRLPDFYTRSHAASKASTLGVSAFLLAVAVYRADLITGAKMVALIAFFFLTAPVAAHMLGRAAYLSGVRPDPATAPDEMRGAYDHEHGILRSRSPLAPEDVV
jgi:multicomponent Na+:H+ antiporter subunit G